jgi:hypothetical protein
MNMSVEQPLFSLARALRGVPMTCLVALWSAERQVANPSTHLLVTLSWLEDVTGYCAPTLRRALKALEAAGLVAFERQGWQLTLKGWELFGESCPPAGTLPGSADKKIFSPTTTAGISLKPDDQNPAAEAESIKRKRAKARRLSGAGPPPDPPAASGPVLQALRSAGIGEPVASQLAGLPHITLDYVRAHVQRARREHTPTGLLIHRMRAADPAPPADTDEEDRLRYVTGKYAEFINR